MSTVGFFNKGQKDGGSEKDQDMAAVIRKLRGQALGLSPHAVEVLPSLDLATVRMVIMEIGYPEAAVSVVAVADGAASMYFSNGRAIIGCGEHGTVRQASAALLECAERHLDVLDIADDLSLAKSGRIKFFVLTTTGMLAGDFDGGDLEAKRLPASELFYAGHMVIAAVRELNLV